MTKASSVLPALAEWYEVAVTASVELPNGWFGRPYDNMHQLTWSADRDNKLFIELDNQLHLILSDPRITTSDTDVFELSCSQIVFDWRSYGESSARHARIFHDGGRVCFHASGPNSN